MLAQTKIMDVAARCGVRPPAIHQVINNERPNPRIREVIAEIIDKPVSEIWQEAKPSQEDAA